MTQISYGTAESVALTDSSGNAIAAHTTVPTFHTLVCNNVQTVDFYLDWNGSTCKEVLNMGAFASKEVPMQMDYYWVIGSSTVKKGSYAATTEATAAEDTLPTAYAPGEFVPKGVIHFLRITAGAGDSGEYEINAYAMTKKY